MGQKNNDYIAIPTLLKIEEGALNRIGTYLKESDIRKVVIFFGNGLIEMFGNTVMESLRNADIEVLEYQELDSVCLEDITTLAFSLPSKTQAVIGLGGGKVIDAAKYSGFLRKLPFISIPTSASSDGFSSASASLIIDNRRNSVPARMAYGIIVDTEVIKTAPDKFLYSGIGDLVAKITALYDWIFEEQHGCGKVNDFAMMIAKKAVNSFVRTPFETMHDDLFIRELMDSLAMSGIANEIADMEREKIICGYHTLIDWDKAGIEKVTAMIEVRVTPQRGMGFDKIAERIYNYPEVNSVYLISGGFDLMVTLEGKTLREVSQFVTDKLSTLDQVLSTKTNFILKKYKDHGTVMATPTKDERIMMA